MRADSERLRQVFLNLVENAVKFTPKGGSVTLRARMLPSDSDEPRPEAGGRSRASPSLRRRAHRVEVRVVDSGIGIPARERVRVFDPFYQVDSSSTREYGGTGLGLSIVKRLVDAHGGKITIEDNEPRGTVFVVVLPLGTSASASAPPPAASPVADGAPRLETLRRAPTVRERERIQRLSALFGGAFGEGIDLGIGDDAAILHAPSDREIVWTVDAHVEKVHFERRWVSWEDCGYRSFIAAASDVSAMGASPWCALGALSLTPDVTDRDLESIAHGQNLAARAVGARIVGGNLSAGEIVTLTTTVLGLATRAIRRSRGQGRRRPLDLRRGRSGRGGAARAQARKGRHGRRAGRARLEEALSARRRRARHGGGGARGHRRLGRARMATPGTWRRRAACAP